MREARYERMRELGVIPANARLSPPEDNVNAFRGPYRGDVYSDRPWTSLDAAERDALDLEMAVYAAMIDRLDQNIGRVIAKLEALDVLDDTLVVFLSDNGACPYDSIATSRFRRAGRPRTARSRPPGPTPATRRSGSTSSTGTKAGRTRTSLPAGRT